MKKKDKLKKQTKNIELLNNDTPFGVRESYLSICTNMMFSVDRDGNPSKVFVITSSVPGEGKSTTAANLAIGFAMFGKKVLLIDIDLRKPTQHKIWGFQAEGGMSNLLSGVNDCLVHKVIDLPISIIGAGNIPPNPSELILSSRFSKIINFLRGKYDYILIDATPMNIVSDARLILENADSVALVVRSEYTDCRALEHALETIEQSNAKCCGFILNDVDLKRGEYAYSYSYSSYGYGEEGQKKKHSKRKNK